MKKTYSKPAVTHYAPIQKSTGAVYYYYYYAS